MTTFTATVCTPFSVALYTYNGQQHPQMIAILHRNQAVLHSKAPTPCGCLSSDHILCCSTVANSCNCPGVRGQTLSGEVVHVLTAC